MSTDPPSPPGPAPTTVVFDLGNVLVRWEPERAWAHLDAAEVDAFRTEVDFRTWNLAMDAGRSSADAVSRLEREAPAHAHVGRAYVERFLDTLAGPVPGTRAVLEELSAAGVRLLALTNWSAELFDRAGDVLEEVVGLSTFEDVVVSGRERLAKPDPALFARVLERFGLEPAATAFVDDSPANVDAAAGLGLRAVLFTGAGALRRDLAGMGLPVAATGG
ncbi:HAD family phosphatase [Pseudokineococcus basanitobsidens]|uniref:HAD family phosphatase n=1 Tax=Pseudokineococcus basanitobsidens TaxID=1926649 RepID=A0ABU8RJY5_9ACTN